VVLAPAMVLTLAAAMLGPLKQNHRCHRHSPPATQKLLLCLAGQRGAARVKRGSRDEKLSC
jgi:hypothetical protein